MVSRTATATAILGLTSLALTACGGTSEPSATASELAARSERVAELIEAGDDCAAEDEARALVASADEAATAGDIDAELADQVAATTQRATAGLTCEPTPDPPAPPPEPEGDDDDDDDEGEDD